MEYTVHLGEESLEKLSKILGGESSEGESEFKTAKVTIINGTSETSVSCTLNPGLPDEEDSVPSYEFKLNIGEGASVEDVTAILYKGYASISTSHILVSDVQGDAEYVEADNIIKISGDCELTIAAGLS